MAVRDWLGFEVLDAPVVTDVALAWAHSKPHVEVIRELAGAGGEPIDETLSSVRRPLALRCTLPAVPALWSSGC